ncbi:hypothetical protein P7C70_g1152, partial [Phenoliferia sp. Uapishka_3]
METTLVPLSFLDTGSSSLSLTFAFILDSLNYNTSKLDLAVGRVCQKWRLVAGRLEFDAQAKAWGVRVPISETLPKSYKTHTFTTSSLPPLAPVDVFTDATAEVVSRPAMSTFRGPYTPAGSSAYEKYDLPFLSIHCSSDSATRTHIGITAPHVVFDGIGLGMIWKAISAELSGASWEAPTLYTENLLLKALAHAPSTQAGTTTDDSDPPFRDWTSPTVGAVVKMLGSMAYEYLWKKAEIREMRIGKDVADHIVSRVKADVATASGGEEFVSTADVLAGFFIKNAYNGERSRNLVSVNLMCSLSSLFPTIPGYPDGALNSFCHNSFAPSPLPLFSVPELQAMTVGDLALLHRKAIVASRSVEKAKAYVEWARTIGGRATPVRHWGGVDHWMFVSEVAAGLAEIEWGQGAKVQGHWVDPMPVHPDHMATVNSIRGGYVVMCGMRRSRWEAVRQELRNVEAEMEKGELDSQELV